tara:strand:+ start:925 stop:1434 length:510 start_codon:yes stop_codon:yes gene_type:complete
MKKINLYLFVFVISLVSFSQEKGQWSFGAGGDFTAPDANANIGYFATDDLLLSFDFEMGLDYEVEHAETIGDITETHTHDVEGEFTWGGSLRYYAKDNMFVEGGLKMGDGYDDPDSYLAGGVSLKLGFDDKLWFEPMIKYTMPGAEISTVGNNESQSKLGLAWAFRYTF